MLGGNKQEGLSRTLTQSPSMHISHTVDNPDILHKVHQVLLYNICLEQFHNFISNTTATEICHRCNLDTKLWTQVQLSGYDKKI